MRPDLHGKTVLITGAARGIGAATACALLPRGVRLVLTGHHREPLEALAAELASPDVITVPCDVRDLAAMEGAVALAVEAFGGVDVVIANAGMTSYGSVQGTDPEVFGRVLETNVLGTFNTLRAARPTLVERRGYVLVVASLASFAAMPGQSAYNASKAGVEQLANAFRLEVQHLGVDVGVAHMAWIESPMLREAKEDLSGFPGMLASLPYPLNRTTPAEVCVEAFVAAIGRRRRHVYVPRWVGALALLRNLVNTSANTRLTFGNRIPGFLVTMDDDVRALGRSTGARAHPDDRGPPAG
jgi:NAD(P)-dependent dehydrogenase (short-subunit alcohol dehydrogenase family)